MFKHGVCSEVMREKVLTLHVNRHLLMPCPTPPTARSSLALLPTAARALSAARMALCSSEEKRVDVSRKIILAIETVRCLETYGGLIRHFMVLF